MSLDKKWDKKEVGEVQIIDRVLVGIKDTKINQIDDVNA